MKTPPKYALKFLRWFCREDYLEEIEGNLIELYQCVCDQSVNKANRSIYWNVILHFRPEYIRHVPLSPSLMSFSMLKNYLKVAVRNVIHHPIFSSINVLGLSLGMLSFLFIFLWIRDEKSIDNFHTNGDHLYNVYTTVEANGERHGEYSTSLQHPDGISHVGLEGIEEVIPEIEYINYYAAGYELPWGHPETFQIGDKVHKLKGSRAYKHFFKMFDYPIIAGDQSTPLDDFSSIAISRKMASLFFDSPEEAIGQQIHFENAFDLTITAVFEDVPTESSLMFEYLINWESHMKRLNWSTNKILTNVQLSPTADVEEVSEKMNRFYQTRVGEIKEFTSVKVELGLQPYRDQYLIANFVNGKPQGGRIEYLRIFSWIAVFILIIACINFMNLTTAHSIRRAKEVGVRKVVGSSRSNLLSQFLGESMFMAMIALMIAGLLLQLLLPYFNQFTGKQITLPYHQPHYWLALLGLMLVTGILAGSYPAIFLASLKPVRILKGTLKFSPSSKWFRKGLTIFQFSLSTLLLIATLVVSLQTNYIQHSHLGYDKENLLYVRVEGELMKQAKYYTFKEQLLNLTGIAMVDRSSEAPHVMGFVVTGPINWEGKDPNAAVGFKPASVGFDFVKLMKLEIVKGRDFSHDFSTDSTDAFLVNEEAVRQMGMKEPIGKWVSAWSKKGHIVGIIKDYHTHSFHEPIKPIMIDIKEDEEFGVILIRTLPGQTKEALASLEKVYHKINPDHAFDYQFVDQEYQALYKSEQVISRLSNVFAFLAVIVSCLGLFGLAMFSAQQRTKEIAIRKVLGASIQQIISLFSREFMLLVGISFVVALPVSWMLLKEWLQGFAYRVELSWWIFAIAGLSAMLIAFFTISSQSLKVAYSNPVESLKDE